MRAPPAHRQATATAHEPTTNLPPTTPRGAQRRTLLPKRGLRAKRARFGGPLRRQSVPASAGVLLRDDDRRLGGFLGGQRGFGGLCGGLGFLVHAPEDPEAAESDVQVAKGEDEQEAFEAINEIFADGFGEL